MITATRSVRLIEPEETANAITKIEEWLELPECLVSTYPQVFGPRRMAKLFGVFSGDELASHAAVHVVELHMMGRIVHAVLIGSVATAPEHRKIGLASDLIRHIYAVTHAAGCDVIMLWSDLWSFYEKLGFVPGGRQFELEFQAEDGEPDGHIREATPNDFPAILRLHNAKPSRVWRTLDHLELLMSTTPMTTVVLERSGEVAAYACLGKGLDFAAWWHELGGSDADAATLVRGAAPRLGLDKSTIMIPTYRAGIVEQFEGIDAQVRTGVSALCLPMSDGGCMPTFVDGLDSI